MTQTVLIIGASGHCGSHVARAFDAAGWQVLRFDRKTQDIVEAAHGADVIFNGANPPNYHNWAENIPRITEDAIRAAKTSGATLIQPGNVYVYGDQPGVMSEETPQTPHTRKGRIRVEMEQRLRRAAADGTQTILVRAGDFIDPVKGGDALQLVYFRNLARARISSGGDPTVQRAYCYLPDYARAVVQLAARKESLRNYEEVPFPGHTFSVLDLASCITALTGRDVTIGEFPWWMMRASAPFWELARELLEMRYLWSLDHRLDGARLAELLPEFQATELPEVVSESLKLAGFTVPSSALPRAAMA